MLDVSSAPEGEYLQKTCVYQPFKVGSVYTGAALSLCKVTELRSVSENSDHPDRDRFIAESANQAAMYDQLIDFIDAHVGIEGKSFLDVAANAGYFCYRASERGASRSLGIDVGDFDRTYELINSALGTNAEFVRGSYDMRAHELSGTDERFDIVSNIAFLCHSSDPTFLLEALAKRAKKAFLIFSKFPRSDDYVIRFAKTTGRYFKQPYPLCFDATTEVSDSLLQFALKDMGFSEILEVPRQSTWIPRSPEWRAFLAIR